MSQVIVPSNMALQQTKLKLKAANKGKDLLKKKADALKVQFRLILKMLIEKKKDLGSKYNESLVYLFKANYAAGEVARIVDENVKNRSDVKLTLKTKNVAGVTIPQFGLRNVDEEKFDESNYLGITGGGQTLNITKKHFQEFLKLIVEIATLQVFILVKKTSYLTLDEALKITNRRVNALEYIVVPRIEYTIKYIDTELQERSKEEKFKIKKVLYNKRKQKEKEIEEANENSKALKAKEESPEFVNFGGEEGEEEEEEDVDGNLFSNC